MVYDGVPPPPHRPAERRRYKKGHLMKAEWNTFPHLCHTPNGDISIRVYCYLPKGQTNELPILFYVHGLGGGNKDKGNGAEWLGTFAEEHHHVIVAPAFPRDEFPSEFYQLGTISSSWESYVPVAEEFWIYNNIEQLFDRVKSMLASKCETYKIFGHSAGGQFVHRFLNAMPDARVSRAVAANPGSWTFPVADGKIDDTGNVYGWPATVKDTPLAEDRRLKSFFARKMLVELGEADVKSLKETYATGSGGTGFMTLPGMCAQGDCRLDRGMTYWKRAHEYAASRGFDCNWELLRVPEVAHEGKKMFAAAIDWLLSD